MCGFLDFLVFEFCIVGSFAFPVLLFDTKAASKNEPNSDQQKIGFALVFTVFRRGLRVVGGR